MGSSKCLLRICVFPLLLICLMVFHACKLDDSVVLDSGDINWTLLGRDDFNRSDTSFDGSNSELGSDWHAFADIPDDANSMIQITGQRVEARGDSGADWKTKTNSSIVKLKIELTTADVSSLNTSSGDLSNTFGFYDEQYNINEGGCPYDTGVGLHSGVYHTYIAKRISTAPGFEELGGEIVTFEANTTYGFEFIINDGSLSFELTDATGDTISKITADGDSCTFVQPGFSMKYVDDESFYFDNFEGYTGETAN